VGGERGNDTPTTDHLVIGKFVNAPPPFILIGYLSGGAPSRWGPDQDEYAFARSKSQLCHTATHCTYVTDNLILQQTLPAATHQLRA